MNGAHQGEPGAPKNLLHIFFEKNHIENLIFEIWKITMKAVTIILLSKNL